MVELEVVRASHGEKAEAVAFVHEKFKTAKMAIVTEYRGLSVAQMTRLRRAIRDASGEYQVIKNTLVRRALKDTAYGSLDRLLEGPTVGSLPTTIRSCSPKPWSSLPTTMTSWPSRAVFLKGSSWSRLRSKFWPRCRASQNFKRNYWRSFRLRRLS